VTVVECGGAADVEDGGRRARRRASSEVRVEQDRLEVYGGTVRDLCSPQRGTEE
jgi:hypothetical protein